MCPSIKLISTSATNPGAGSPAHAQVSVDQVDINLCDPPAAEVPGPVLQVSVDQVDINLCDLRRGQLPLNRPLVSVDQVDINLCDLSESAG